MSPLTRAIGAAALGLLLAAVPTTAQPAGATTRVKSDPVAVAAWQTPPTADGMPAAADDPDDDGADVSPRGVSDAGARPAARSAPAHLRGPHPCGKVRVHVLHCVWRE